MALGDFVVMSFVKSKNVGEVSCRSRKEATERAAFRPTGEDGAIAYEVVKTSNGTYEAKIIAQYGDVPNDLSPFFRG